MSFVHHSGVDLEYWEARMAESRNLFVPPANVGVNSAFQLLDFNAMRPHFPASASSVRTHLILWNEGISHSPYITRVGGWAFAPAELVGSIAPPFFCQFYFGDSLSLFGCKLPGDLLLVFWDKYSLDVQSMEFKWLDVDSVDLAQVDKDIVTGYPWGVLTGSLWAGTDFRVYEERASYASSKIAGLYPTHLPNGYSSGRLEKEDVHLCTLNSFLPDRFCPYLNKEISIDFRVQENLSLMFGDGGCLDFFMTRSGDVYAEMTL